MTIPRMRADWVQRRVIHEVTPAALALAWGFTAVWYGATLGMAVLVLLAPPAEGRGVAFGVLAMFLAAGLFLVYIAVRATRHRIRFGRSSFLLDDAPFAV